MVDFLQTPALVFFGIVPSKIKSRRATREILALRRFGFLGADHRYRRNHPPPSPRKLCCHDRMHLFRARP